jgi:hypothetical protein
MPVSIQMNDRQLRKFLQAITVLPRVRKKRLLNEVGLMAQSQTRKKIEAGNYAAPSKWTVAKKGVNKALRGVAGKVFWQRLSDNMGIVETKDPRFSLSQHFTGFTTPAGSGGPQDYVFGDWVVLPPLKQRFALNPPNSDPFTWRWKTHRTPSVVPARDILPEERVLALRSEMIAERWAKKLVNEALQKAGKIV